VRETGAIGEVQHVADVIRRLSDPVLCEQTYGRHGAARDSNERGDHG